jgi:hypothetical protein
MGNFVLCFIEHVNVLWDPICLGIVPHHLRREVDNFTWVEATAICIKILNKLLGGHVVVVQMLMAYIMVLKFIFIVPNELS